jgi:hypothetical protein
MSHSVDSHFEGKSSRVRDIYDTIVAVSREFGPVTEEAKKTSIHLNRKSAFAGVQTRREYLILTVKSAVDVDHSRIARREHTSANRWHHEIKLHDASDVDNQLIDWLRVSYEMSG